MPSSIMFHDILASQGQKKNPFQLNHEVLCYLQVAFENESSDQECQEQDLYCMLLTKQI